MKSKYRFVILAVFMFLSLVIQVQWLAHAAVARPAAVFYQGQFNPDSFFNIDFLAMLYMLIYVVISIPASYIIDTFGIRTGLSIGAALTIVFGMMKGILADNFTAVVIAQVGLAVAQPFILNAITAVTARWFPLKERGLMAGFLSLAQYLGIIIAMLVTPMLVGSDPLQPDYGEGFKRMLMIYGWFSVLAGGLVLVFIREHPKGTGEPVVFERFGFKKGLNHMIKNPSMILMILLFFLGLGIFNAVSSMTDAIAAKAGVEDSDGLIGGLMLVGGIIGAIILPALSDKYRKRKLFLVICIAGMVPGLAGLAFAGYLSQNTETVYLISIISSFILGFFVMSAGPIGFQYVAEINYPAPESTSQGILLWVGQISGLIFVTGMSSGQNRYLPAFLIAFVVLSLVSVVLVSFIRESAMIGSTDKQLN